MKNVLKENTEKELANIIPQDEQKYNEYSLQQTDQFLIVA